MELLGVPASGSFLCTRRDVVFLLETSLLIPEDIYNATRESKAQDGVA